MKKYINYKSIIASVFIASSIISCNDDDVDYANIQKPIVSITSQTSTSVMEGEFTTITLTSNQAYSQDLEFKLELISGGQNEDYFVGSFDDITTPGDGYGADGYKVIIPAYETTADFSITAFKDILAEGTEDLVFSLRSSGTGIALVEDSSSMINLSVTNFVADEFAMKLEWGNDLDYQINRLNVLATDADDEVLDMQENGCDIIDFDVFLGGNEAYAYTGDCPEYVDVDNNTTSVLADGTYDVYVDMWDFYPDLDSDFNDEIAQDFNLPIKLTVAKTGQIHKVIEINDLFKSNSETSASGGNGSKIVASVIVNAGDYTILDRFGNPVE